MKSEEDAIRRWRGWGAGTGGGEEGPSMKSEEVWDKKEFNDSRQALSPEFCNMTGSTDFTFKMHYLVILDSFMCFCPPCH